MQMFVVSFSPPKCNTENVIFVGSLDEGRRSSRLFLNKVILGKSTFSSPLLSTNHLSAFSKRNKLHVTQRLSKNMISFIIYTKYKYNLCTKMYTLQNSLSLASVDIQ